METEKTKFLSKAGEKLSFVNSEALDMNNSVWNYKRGSTCLFFFLLPALWLVNDKWKLLAMLCSNISNYVTEYTLKSIEL